MSEQPQQQTKKPTYRDLWHEQQATLLDIWQGGTKLDANSLSILWNYYPVSKEAAELALSEYNEIFHTQYTLDQVDIPLWETAIKMLMD
jgi:hypothetical protein